MELEAIIAKCKTLTIYEERFVADDYYEIVFDTKDTSQWTKLLKSILGPIAKPTGIEPSKKDTELIQKYGGIRENQILFKKQVGDTVVVAMLWPWQDGVRTTLKVAFIKK